MNEITFRDLSKTAQRRIRRASKAINGAINYLEYRGFSRLLYEEEITLLKQARDCLANKNKEEAEAPR